MFRRALSTFVRAGHLRLNPRHVISWTVHPVEHEPVDNNVASSPSWHRRFFGAKEKQQRQQQQEQEQQDSWAATVTTTETQVVPLRDYSGSYTAFHKAEHVKHWWLFRTESEATAFVDEWMKESKK